MPSELLRLGDLPRLQHLEVPKEVGDIQVQRIYDQYRDSHFTDGWALRTEPIALQSFFEITQSTRNRETVHELLDCYGALQISCPELRQQLCVGTAEVNNRTILVPPHKDGDYIRADTILTGHAQEWPTGPTLVLTNRLMIWLLLQHQEIRFSYRSNFREAFDRHHEYADPDFWDKYMRGGINTPFYNAVPECQESFLRSLQTFFAGVLTHSWSDNEGLLFSNLRTFHTAGVQGKGKLSFSQMFKIDDLKARQIERSRL